LNDRVLDEIKERHNYATKEDALNHISLYPEDAKSVFNELVAQNSGNIIKDQIYSKGESLDNRVKERMPENQMFDYDQLSNNMKSQYDKASIENDQATSLVDKIDQNIEAEQEKAKDSKASQSMKEFQENMNDQGFGGNVKIGGAEQVQAQIDEKQQKFDEISDSTIGRTKDETWKNIKSTLNIGTTDSDKKKKD